MKLEELKIGTRVIRKRTGTVYTIKDKRKEGGAEEVQLVPVDPKKGRPSWKWTITAAQELKLWNPAHTCLDTSEPPVKPKGPLKAEVEVVDKGPLGGRKVRMRIGDQQAFFDYQSSADNMEIYAEKVRAALRAAGARVS